MYSTECTSFFLEIIFYVILYTVISSILERMSQLVNWTLIFIIFFSLCVSKCSSQNFGINVPITGSLDVTVLNSTQTQIGLTSTLCIYYPKEASDEIKDSEWKNTVVQLLLTKGWPTTSVYLNEYDDLAAFSNDPKLYCDYNIVLVKYTGSKVALDISELAELLLYEWLCNPMDVTLYYYQQTSESNKWIAMGTSCTIKVCPLNAQTLGIGCQTTNVNTFEQVTASEQLAIIDVVDGVNHKINYTSNTCTIKNCVRLNPRTNVAIIQIGGPEILDISEDPMVVPKMARMTRINWKKWWQVFYTIVDYIDTIVNAMSKRATSLDASSYYFRV
ncbi:VP7 [Rotavirus A pheasant-wt/HUN/216/2015/G23P[37]]|uniref:Outer capsid glycoprotein VP7 n=1 Tax=Rotavirus A pheasant-wt/HUN/216/2015/G23P[37] TaxID=1795042 RepID=A0A125RLH5_9REOV|nr:VP7 [Rotavirus A pheasant-wt/HUN/216/2015/G23P[37]]